jgi:hypothetical protein
MRDRPHRDNTAQAVPLASPFQASPSPSPETSRRRFLFAIGVTGAGAAAASAAALAATAAPAAKPVEDRASRGYQESEHVRRYYTTART